MRNNSTHDKLYSVANYIIDLTNRYNENVDFNSRISMSCKRLINLLYLFDLHHMIHTDGEPCLDKDFYAWPKGPAILDIYVKFAQFQTGEMRTIESINYAPLTPHEKSIALLVFESTINLPTSKLNSICCLGPWQDIYDPNDPKHEQVIPNERIYKYWKDIIHLNSHQNLETL